jgi:hypothetical protein
MKSFIVSISIFVIAALIAFPASSKDFRTKDGFTIHLPDNWIEIPEKVLREYSNRLSDFIPELEKQSYDYGYQIANLGQWFQYPYILIQVKRVGRLQESDLKKYKWLKKSIAEELKTVPEKMGNLVSNAQQSEMVYDSVNQILWMTISMNVKNAGSIKAIIAAKLTEFGLIQIMGYEKADSAQQFMPVFKDIAIKATLSPDIVYKRQLIDYAPVIGGINIGKVIRGAVIGGIAGGFVGLVLWFFKRNRSTTNK